MFIKLFNPLEAEQKNKKTTFIIFLFFIFF